MSDQLQVLFFAIAATWACVCIGALIVTGAVVRMYVREGLDRRAAKRARIDVHERSYRERLTARNSRPAGSVTMSVSVGGREIARAIQRQQNDRGARC